MLSSIQQGIQAAHVIGEMAAWYKDDPENAFFEWAESHKTIQLMNGGNHEAITNIVQFFCDLDEKNELHKTDKFSWSVFREDRQSLNSAVTCAGIIVPTHVCRLVQMCGKESARSHLCGYNEDTLIARDDDGKMLELEFSYADVALADFLKKFRYAS